MQRFVQQFFRRGQPTVYGASSGETANRLRGVDFVDKQKGTLLNEIFDPFFRPMTFVVVDDPCCPLTVRLRFFVLMIRFIDSRPEKNPLPRG